MFSGQWSPSKRIACRRWSGGGPAALSGGDAGDRETHAFYNIDTDYNPAVLEESTLITFTQEGDNNTGWTVSITAGEITQLQKVDQDAGITDLHLVSEEEAATKEATAPANGLYKKTLTFAAP